MTTVPRDDSPREERRAIANVIGWMERPVAPAVGTARDRPSMDFRGSGDRSQQDCVDEATNTTSYLLVLARHGLIRHHAVERPFAKDNFGKWTHWAALIRAKESGELFAVDWRVSMARTLRCNRRQRDGHESLGVGHTALSSKPTKDCRWKAEPALYAGAGPNTSTALRPPKAKEFDMA
jgi:hypothetical protein